MSFNPVARFVHGTPIMVDYTPVSAVAAGDINVLGSGSNSHFIIAHSDIAAGAIGAGSVGNAVYDIQKNASDSFLDRQQVPFNTSTHLADSGILLGGTNTGLSLGITLGVPSTTSTTMRVLVIAQDTERTT